MDNNLTKFEGKPIGILLTKNKVGLLITNNDNLSLFESTDGFEFYQSERNFQVDNLTHEEISNIKFFGVNMFNNKYLAAYLSKKENKTELGILASDDGYSWNNLDSFTGLNQPAVIVPDYLYKDNYVVYYGDKNISLATSQNLNKFKLDSTPLITPSSYRENTETLGVHSVYTTDDGILLFYYRKTKLNKTVIYSLNSILFSKNNPRKILWELNGFWTQPIGWIEKKITPLGSAFVNSTLVSYWFVEGEGLHAVPHMMFSFFRELKSKNFLILNKHHKNPIIEARGHNPWESAAVFNPTAIHDRDKTHILYRAVGDRYLSTIGYASSSDGIHIDERLDYPVYVPRESFEGISNPGVYNPKYVSGPGWGGCEDPRITKIDGRFYLTYVAFDGMNPPRAAMSSISEEDFHNKDWNWDKPKLISRPGEINKSVAILPEKVNGKYVIFHRVFPHILVDYVDDLNFSEDQYLIGHHRISPRDDYWDSRKVGVGPAPVKTDKGWLMIYHAVDDKDDGKYKFGAMLLDHDHPERVIGRTNNPILEPDMWYENNGHKAGVAYPCGSTITNGTLNVYYGGSDSTVCLAQADVNEVTEALLKEEPVRLSTTIPF